MLLIFPELPFIFTESLSLGGSSLPQSAGEKGSEKQDYDCDDPHRRFSKLTAMGPFMHARPTLLATLNPAVSWEGDHWTSLDDAPYRTRLYAAKSSQRSCEQCVLFHMPRL